MGRPYSDGGKKGTRPPKLIDRLNDAQAEAVGAAKKVKAGEKFVAGHRVPKGPQSSAA